MIRNTRTKSICAAALVSALALAGCANGSGGEDGEGVLRVAPQFGLAYLPNTVMQDQGFLDDALPEMTIENTQLSSGGAITEQLISGAVDIGYMGPAPFLQSVDSGADIRMLGCLDEVPMEIMVNDDSLNSIADLDETHRIAVPGPNSQQTTLLRLAANEEFGEPARFDNQLMSMPHPDAMAALGSGQDVTAHFTMPPFIEIEREEGHKSIMHSYDILGPHCLIVAATTTAFAENNPTTIAGFREALNQSVDFINDNPEAAGQMLVDAGEATSIDSIVADITNPEVTWTTSLDSVQAIADAMWSAGLLQEPINVDEVTAGDS